MSREIEIINYAEGAVSFDAADLREMVFALDANLPANMRAPEGLLSIAVFDDAQLAEIHQDFLGDPAITDVITFDGDPQEGFAGEVCVSAERALDCAAEYGNTPDAELLLYVAHGYLHLAGLDDMTEHDAKKMREGEALALKIITGKLKLPVFKFITTID